MGFIGLTLGFSLGCRSAIAMLVNLVATALACRGVSSAGFR